MDAATDARLTVREFLRPGSSGLPVRTLWRVGEVLIAGAIVVTDLVGAEVVIAIGTLVIPLPSVAHSGHVRLVNVVVGVIYAVVAVPVGAVAGIRGLYRLRVWLVSGSAATPAEVRTVLRAPVRLFVVQMAFWVGAAVAFTVLDAGYSTTLALRLALAIALTGLGTGVPVAGLVLVGAEQLLGGRASHTELATVTVVLGAVGLTVGLLAISLAARATADPVDAVRHGLSRVQGGYLDVAVPVYDGTQLGQLQLGFNRMVAGLAERERIREALGIYLDPDVAARALSAAVAIAEVADELKAGVGLNSGSVVAGNIGGAGRLEFSVIGDVVNTAARVEASTRQTGDVILISEATRSRLSRPWPALAGRHEVRLEGKVQPVRLYAYGTGSEAGERPGTVSVEE